MREDFSPRSRRRPAQRGYDDRSGAQERPELRARANAEGDMNDAAENPFARYDPYGRGTAPQRRAQARPTAYGPAATLATQSAPAVLTASETRRHIGFAIFHDGNPGHLWRGETFSQLGEVTLSVGLVIWLALLTGSPLVVALAVALLAAPYALVGPFAAPLQNRLQPGIPMRWIGRVRIALALAFVPLHFRTILPLVFVLIFALSFCGRLRDALRIAAIRACLAPGEPEHVANDTQIGATVVAVLGPLVATLLIALAGQRILALSPVAALLFLMSMNSDSFLDALPEGKRAYLLATPETTHLSDEDATHAVEAVSVELAAVDDSPNEEARALQRELALPEWYQQGPKNVWQAFGDIRAGLGLAGTRGAATTALLALAALALIGGGLAALEVGYLVSRLGILQLYLGPLLAAEATGAALGALLAEGLAGRGWRVALVIGALGAGAALLTLGLVTTFLLALVGALLLGAMNVVAVVGARQGLLAGFDGVERRALVAAEREVTAFCALVGALLLPVFAVGSSALPARLHLAPYLPGWPINQFFLLLGIGVALTGLCALLGGSGKRSATGEQAAGTRRRDGKDGETGESGESVAGMPALADEGWDETGEASRYTGAYRDTGYETGYTETGYGETGYTDAGYATGYDETGYRSAEYTGYTGAQGRYDATGEAEAAPGEDDASRGGARSERPPRRPPPGGSRQLRW